MICESVDQELTRIFNHTRGLSCVSFIILPVRDVGWTVVPLKAKSGLLIFQIKESQQLGDKTVVYMDGKVRYRENICQVWQWLFLLENDFLNKSYKQCCFWCLDTWNYMFK